MRLRSHNRPRRGASLVETALVCVVFLTLVLGAIDLGTALFRYHILSQAARQGARQAIVHGALAPDSWNGGSWGPPAGYPTSNPYTVAASSSSDYIASGMASSLAGLDTSQTNITVQWMDNGTDVGDRVQVTVTTTWTPMLGFIFGNQSVTLSASSMMPIAH